MSKLRTNDGSVSAKEKDRLFPSAFRKYDEIKAEKEQLKEDLKQAKTKEEVQQIHSDRMMMDVATKKALMYRP